MPSLRNMSLRGALALTTAAVAWTVPVHPVHAASGGGSIEEITVTANKRKENLEKVPIAITAISASAAKKMGVTDMQSLVGAVPGLTWNRQAMAAIPFLRGIGAPVGQPGDEPSVAYYVDDVYMPAGAGSLSNFNSIASVEIDKGPQGTLFGRNATGGAIQVFTKDPTPTPSIDLDLGYANYNTPSGAIYATGAITSKVSANLSAYWSRQYDGWGHNVCSTLYATQGCSTSGADGLNQDYGGRLKILFVPTDDTKILLNMDYDDTKSSEGMDFRAFPGTLPNSFLIAPPAAPPSGFYDTATDETANYNISQYGLSLKINHTFDWAKLQTITSWRGLDAPENLDNDTGWYAILDTHLNTVEKTQSQEVQLSSPDDSTLKWVGGLYYYNDYVKAPYYYYGAFFGVPPNDYGIGQGTQSTTSYSAYGQATATILPDTHLTAGLRFTDDRRQFDSTYIAPGANGWVDNVGFPITKKWPKVTYRFTLDHQFTPDIMGYIAYNRGFKSGVFNTTVSAGPAATGNPGVFVQPETLDSYTIGSKAELFDHRLRVNVEGFYYIDKNIQADSVGPDGTILTNGPSATIKGVDLDLTAQPIEHLRLTADAEVMNGKFDSFPGGPLNYYCVGAGNPVPSCIAPGGNATVAHSLAGDDTIETPPFTLTLAGTYTIPTSTGPVSLNVSLAHGGNYYFDPDNGHGQVYPSSSNNDRQPITNLVNASTSWTSEDGRWGATLWGKNLTGEQYYSFGLEAEFATQYSPAPPRTFGITLHMHLEPGTSPVAEAPAAAAPVEMPAPAPAPAPEAQRAFQVFFDFDKSAITSAAADTIQKAADEVNAGHIASINVTGHTDTVGSDEYNQKLSEKRAAAVKKQLQADGVSASEIATVGVGKSGLLVPTPDGTREPQNRRAEIVLQ